MKKILAIAVATAISAPAMADLTIGGSARFDVKNTDSVTDSAGRVALAINGSTSADNGMTASYSSTVLLGFDGQVTNDTASMTIGNDSFSAQMGYFDTYKAFNVGSDTFVPADSVVGYSAPADRAKDATDNNIQLTATVAEGTNVIVSTKVSDDDQNVAVALTTTLGSVSLGAQYDSAAGSNTDDGVLVTAGTTVEGVALNASYAEAGTAKSTNVNASYMGLALAVSRDEAASTDETTVYGTYTVSDVAGLAGASVIIGGGSNDTGDIMGVRLNYAF
jgi:hypothetical protein